MKALVAALLLPSLAFGQAAPWLAERCTNKVAKHPQMVDVPPSADNPQGAWLFPDQLVCAVDAELKKTERVVYRDRDVEVTRAAPIAVAFLLGLIAGAAGVLVLQAQHSQQL